MQELLLSISKKVNLNLELPLWLQKPLFRDPRINQILFLGSFLIYGLFFLNWQPDLFRYGITISVCLLTQLLFIFIYKKDLHSLKSALITSLGLCLLFRSNEMVIIALAAFLAIASKFTIQHKGKHFFNPANFGIVVAILLTGSGWISPGQWGSSYVLLGFFLITGINILLRVGRMDTGIVFLTIFASLQFCYQILYLNWPVDHFFHQLSSGTLLLFSFFMITDPVTTPNAPKARIIWAIMVAVLAFALTRIFHVHTAPLWALFIISPLTVLFDKIFIYKKFNWL